MPVGLLGRKCGMTRIFDKDGKTIPISVVAIEPNYVTQIKTVETDGYQAIQVTTGTCKDKHMPKAIAGHLAAAKVATGKKFLEFRLFGAEKTDLTLGAMLTVTRFKDGEKIDITGYSKGKGYAGVMKKHNFSGLRASHGVSISHRAPGSIGQNQSPGRVFKGKKMAGRLGNTKVTVHNLEIIRVDEKRNVLLIKGAIPGAPGGNIIIRPAIKIKTKTTDAA
jgi:large subunit ribosomal protein L3